MRRKKTPFFKIILIVILLAFGARWAYNFNIYSPVDESDDSVISFQVKKGENLKEISKNLQEKDLIRNGFFFNNYAKSNKLDTKILAGRFLLQKNMNVPEILEKLSDPSQSEMTITIQEGLTTKDIENKLVELGLTHEGEFLNGVNEFNGWEYYNFIQPSEVSGLPYPLEGFLYPDTYFLEPETFVAEDMIYLALDNFEKKWEAIKPTGESKLDQYSLHEVLTMASIIENEVFGKEDKQIVSGILWKRLENSWTIGADATLLYITKDRTITSEDLALDSPYNTRKNLGLPPGPISNPSTESIEAALYPKKTDYWFYLTTLDTGEVIYSKTNEEHNLNREKYL